MSELPKPSMAEVPPEPEPVIPSRAPRARVTNHLRHLLTMGATSASLACWPLACDPIAPPAECREKGSVLSSIAAEVTAAGAGQLEVAIKYRPSLNGDYGVKLTRTTISGGTSTTASVTSPAISLERVTPSSPSAVIQLNYTATCQESAAKGIRVTLTPRTPDGGTTDGGAADGGTPAQYDLALTEV